MATDSPNSTAETVTDPVASAPPSKPAAPARNPSAADLVKPSPFPPLSLMHDRTQSVTHALTQSAIAGGARLAPQSKGKAKADADAEQGAGAVPGPSKAHADGKPARKWKPGLKPGEAAKKLFPKPNFLQRAHRRFFIKRDLKYGRDWTPEELDEAAKRGNFPYRPSDLFLKMYADVLTTLTRDPLAGNVSPALIGTQGTIPLSVVSTIPDIMQHYYDCIVLAEREVFLVTNYWQPSDSVTKIAAGLTELNKRVGERNGEKIVVKVMWDRGAIQQLWHNHVAVQPETWIPLGLPDPAEVPHLSLQVINFHRPLLGTFHQKAMVVDRKIALLNSNNIQDRPNLEMMVHLEGPVVDSIYDNILISWDEGLTPSLPCLLTPSPSSDPSLFPYSFSDHNPYLANIDVAKAAKAARILLSKQEEKAKRGEEGGSLSPPDWWRRDSTAPHSHLHPFHLGGTGSGPSTPGATAPGSGAGAGAGAGGEGEEGGKFAALVMQLVEKAREEKARLAMGMSTLGERGLSGVFDRGEGSPPATSRPSTSGNRPVLTSPLTAEPLGVEGDESLADSGFEAGSKSEEETGSGQRGQQGAAEKEKEKSALKVDTLQPTGGHPLSMAASDPKPPGMEAADNATGAALPAKAPNTTASPSSPSAQPGPATAPAPFSPGSPTSPTTNGSHFSNGTASSARLAALSKALNAGALTKIEAAFDDESLIADFKPHMLHKSHEPFPMALVNRRPHGSPGHNDLRCPQDAAWLAALRYAENNVFIQTPTLNARPLVRGIIDACSRGGPKKQGIAVTLFLDLGFNDKGESIPFQGGTNEQVVFRLYAALREVKKEGNLHVFWYTGKDQTRPLNAIFKSRNCHIKFLAVDSRCGIVGNGNMDSQSFWHSQEANILIDSPQIVGDWMDQLRTNQSTHKFGRVDTDGIWRDPTTGEELEKPKKIGCITALRAVI
ncbi:hypothetical protein JCM10207_008208 [Rhodosporidiobolus poonsookiae]